MSPDVCREKMGGTTERPPSQRRGARCILDERRSMEPVARQLESFGMFVLRLWMWAVPVLMLAAALLFAAIAAADGSWGLFVIMLVMALTAVALFVFHWWVLY